MLKINTIILLALMLLGCEQSHHTKHESVIVYQQAQPDFTTMYWYIMISDSGTGTSRPSAYYQSATRLSSLNGVQFTKGVPPREIEDEIEEGKEPLEQDQVEIEEEATPEASTETTESASPSESTESGGSSGGDSGGSDGGGAD